MPRGSDDIALPVDFGARCGDGIERGLCLGGGGLFVIAWQIAYLRRLTLGGALGIPPDRVVGTSAGSVVATALLAGNLNRVHRELTLLSKLPSVIAALAPAGDLHASQLRAVDLFRTAREGGTPTVRAIGHAALAAQTPSESALSRTIAVLAGGRRWPSPALWISCVDAYTGERCMITERTGVSAAAAAAASSAVPGIFAPQTIGDRRCMDGGVSGSGTHLDVLGGARRVLVLALTDGEGSAEGMMTVEPGGIRRELDELSATGAHVEFRMPERFDPDELMSPAAVPKALALGSRQADADLGAIRAFWST